MKCILRILTSACLAAIISSQALAEEGPCQEKKLAQKVACLNVRLAKLEAAQGPAIAAGTVVVFAGPTVPVGWELCDGRTLPGSDAKYRALFAAIQLTYGGSGTNFVLPNYQGKFLRGGNIGNTGGSEQHVHTEVVANANPHGAGFGDVGTRHLGGTNAASHLPPFSEVKFIIKL